MDWLWITEDQQLQDYCLQCLARDYIAVDTEFIRTRTFFPIVGLIQIYDGQQIALIDPDGISDWSGFRQLMSSSVVKVFHACGEDLELLRHVLACEINALFDTQIAWAMLGHEASISFQRLVMHFADVELDKSATRTDWCARPLSQQQLEYAAADVFYLYPIYPKLVEQLQAKGRMSWLQDEMQWLWSQTELADIEAAYVNVSGIAKLSGAALKYAYYLAEWRERTCREQDLARPFVLHDNSLVLLAEKAANGIRRFYPDDRLKPAQIRRWSDQWLACFTAADASDKEIEPVQGLDRKQQQIIKNLKKQIKEVARQQDIEAPLLCSNRDLGRLIMSGELPSRLSLWRRPLLIDILAPYLKAD